MKQLLKIACLLAVAFTSAKAVAQDARALVKEGLALNNAHNYAGAIEKYKAALSIDPNNTSANYQLAFSLNASGKGQEALPYLQKVTQSGASAAIMGSAYELMGSIYDKANQPQKSIDSYLQGVKADSSSESLRYNLGLAYFRDHQYAEAEQSAVSALKINPKHASSMRLYALVTFHQDKRAAALLGFCTFLWLEPTSARSAEAYGNIQHLIQGGVLKPEPGEVRSHHIDANTNVLNQAITQAVDAVAKRRYLMAVDMPSEQLQAIFAAVGQLAAKQGGKDLFHQQATWYLRLAQSGNVPAFAHLIRQSSDKNAASWITLHPKEMAALQEWVKDNAM